MKEKGSVFSRVNNRRSFLKNGMVAAGATTMGAALLPGTAAAFGKEEEDHDHAPITKDDIAILTFLSALEQVEADLWIQYAELGGATRQGLSPIDLELNGQKITSLTIPTMRSVITDFSITTWHRRAPRPSTSVSLRSCLQVR